MRINRKNESLESTLPLTISAQYGLVKQNSFFNKQVASKNLKNYILLRKGDFAYNKSYSKDSPYGAIKRLNCYPKGVISSLYIAFKPNGINSKFLEIYYESDKWYKEIYKRAAEGARNHGLLNISPHDFFDTLLKISTSKKEQEKIGILLSYVEKLILLQQRKLNDLEQIKQALEDYIFPDNNENRKLIFNKNKWKHKKIKDIFEERNIRDGKENLLTVSISKGVVPFNSMKREINSSSDKSNYKVVKIGDIAYNSMRMWQGACGVSKYDGIVSPAYTVIRAKEHENALFYFYYFKNERMKFIFQKNSQGLTSDTWNLKFPLLKRITVLTPENEKEQIRVSKLFNKVSLIVKQTGKEIAYLNLVKKFLLQKMFF
ncbi:restriction endonuclease subunit S [Lactobacillus ultunensis]|uniref:Type I restriction modification DNA specificity domain-containing protein n=2 Tax=Lactobacillus ultunensis TaxID=227945 RepID=C2EN51_9LACO|nr:restriction endonuclease subunit S [Lactobacillus ultunensis]EEJ72047.1 hypothetical protein HMPREF0548_1097 [Lactobacillus ultunensis DSM 16047]KRL82120.1 type I site-specific deoxyribonuclease specificity subunit [Lactobacillus ultunensis DSM 16047]